MSDLISPASFSDAQTSKRGLLLVDKPVGPTSHDIVAWARKVFQIKKIGHTGTLDPLASGLLILLISRDFTKLQTGLLKQDKSYLVTAELGVTSDTYDCLGEVTKSSITFQPSMLQVEATVQMFVGEIDQEVPAFSAVKVGGQKLYKLARRKAVLLPNLPSRKVTITKIDLIDYAWPFVTLRIDCSSGTYVRSLINDLGKQLKVGAVVSKLRRERIGSFSIQDASVCPYFIWCHRSLLTTETNLGDTTPQ